MRRLFIESSLFSREIKRLIKENKLSEDDYKKFQEELLKDPRAGSVIPGLGGLRKIRLGFRGKGTRGGLTILIYLKQNAYICWSSIPKVLKMI
jgi:hypothetical protein